MSDETVTLKLKTLVRDQMGEVVSEVARLEATRDQLEGKTNSEIKDMAPKLDYGTLILRILATSIKPKDSEAAGKIYVYIKSIRNKYKSAKSEWHLDEKDLLELKEYIKKAEGTLLSPMMAGQIWEIISDLEVELKEKTKQKEKKSLKKDDDEGSDD